MKETTITCDRCGESWLLTNHTNRPQLWSVGLIMDCNQALDLSAYRSYRLKAEWCRPCVESFGLIGENSEKAEARTMTTSERLEELIMEIALEAGA